MNAAVLLLTDARFPAGGHAHSGGLEPAVSAGTITDISTLEVFLRGRLRTAGATAAGLAAVTCAHIAAIAEAGDPHEAGEPGEAGEAGEEAWFVWEALDCEADARTPSPAQREASRRQGRALLRAARNAWPHARWPPRHAAHHAVVLGAATAAANGTPHEAAQIAAYHSISGPASAAVRLLALDPMRVAAVLASLMTAVDETAALAARYADGPLAALPGPSAPALDLMAEAHIRTEARLFES